MLGEAMDEELDVVIRSVRLLSTPKPGGPGILVDPTRVRRELAAQGTVPCHACCGGVKTVGHEPGCEDDIRRRMASGMYD